MSPKELPLDEAPEVNPVNDFQSTLDYVHSVARAYDKNPNTKPDHTVTLSNGSTLNAEFVSSYDRGRGECYRAHSELPISEDIKGMLNGTAEIYLNARGSKQMLRIWLIDGTSEATVSSTRQRLYKS